MAELAGTSFTCQDPDDGMLCCIIGETYPLLFSFKLIEKTWTFIITATKHDLSITTWHFIMIMCPLSLFLSSSLLHKCNENSKSFFITCIASVFLLNEFLQSASLFFFLDLWHSLKWRVSYSKPFFISQISLVALLMHIHMHTGVAIKISHPTQHPIQSILKSFLRFHFCYILAVCFLTAV